MYNPSERAGCEEQLRIADVATEGAESGGRSVHDAASGEFGVKGTEALDYLNSEFTVEEIEKRRAVAALAAAEAQIDRYPGAAIELGDRSDAMERFVGAVNKINRAKGAGAASSTHGDFQKRYANPQEVVDGMERKAQQAEHDADIARRILTGEAALIAAGFDETYAMAVRVAIRKELDHLRETGPKARAARIEAVKKTQHPKH